MVESITHTFFLCPVVQPVWKLFEGYILRVQNGKFFVLKASSVCCNEVPSLNKTEYSAFFGLKRVFFVSEAVSI